MAVCSGRRGALLAQLQGAGVKTPHLLHHNFLTWMTSSAHSKENMSMWHSTGPCVRVCLPVSEWHCCARIAPIIRLHPREGLRDLTTHMLTNGGVHEVPEEQRIPHRPRSRAPLRQQDQPWPQVRSHRCRAREDARPPCLFICYTTCQNSIQLKPR